MVVRSCCFDDEQVPINGPVLFTGCVFLSLPFCGCCCWAVLLGIQCFRDDDASTDDLE